MWLSRSPISFSSSVFFCIWNMIACFVAASPSSEPTEFVVLTFFFFFNTIARTRKNDSSLLEWTFELENQIWISIDRQSFNFVLADILKMVDVVLVHPKEMIGLKNNWRNVENVQIYWSSWFSSLLFISFWICHFVFSFNTVCDTRHWRVANQYENWIGKMRECFLYILQSLYIIENNFVTSIRTHGLSWKSRKNGE